MQFEIEWTGSSELIEDRATLVSFGKFVLENELNVNGQIDCRFDNYDYQTIHFGIVFYDSEEAEVLTVRSKP